MVVQCSPQCMQGLQAFSTNFFLTAKSFDVATGSAQTTPSCRALSMFEKNTATYIW